MKNLILIAMTALALTIFNGCQKENPEVDQLVDGPQPQEAVKQDEYVENGYLAFKNMKAVDSLIQILNKMTRAEKEIWEKEMRFKSARSVFDVLFDEYENLSTYESFLSFKEKNKERLKFNEEDPDNCSIDYPFATVYFTPVLNNEGTFKVGKSLIKYTKNDHFIVADGDVNKLNNLDCFMNDKMVIRMPKLKSISNNETTIHYFPEDHPRKSEGITGIWHMKNNISKRRINHQLFAEQYMIWETENRWVNGIKIILNQRGQKHSLLKWRDYNTTYGISDIRVKVGSEPTWEDDRMYISQEIRPSINFLLYHAWSVQAFPPESFLPIPDVNFAANVTFRGFGFEGSDFYKIDIPEGYGIGNNIVVPPGGWWGIGY